MFSAAEIEEREPALLEEAKAHLPKIHFAQLDVLVIDRIGKRVLSAGRTKGEALRGAKDKKGTSDSAF